MSDEDLRSAERIERLEAQIDVLHEAIGRSRRLAAAGRACALFGAAWLTCLALGLAMFTEVRMIAGIVIALGGIVLMGSSVGSTRQLELAQRQAEEQRNAAIDALKLVAVRDGAGRIRDVK